MGAVRVAIIGVGNCASSLVQGVCHYRAAPDDGFIPGLMHPRLDGYHVGDIEFSAAFDIDARKVGRDLSEAIFEEPNNTVRFAEVPRLDVPVQRGMTHDGLGAYLSQRDQVQQAIRMVEAETIAEQGGFRLDGRWIRFQLERPNDQRRNFMFERQ